MPWNVPHVAVRCRLFETGPWFGPRSRVQPEIVIVFERDNAFSIDAVRAFLITNAERFYAEPDELRLRICGSWRSRKRFDAWASARARGLVGWYGPWRLDGL